MKFRNHKMLASVIVAAGVICCSVSSTVAGSINTNGGRVNAGSVNLPDAGASIWLLALGCSGMALAARKRFFKR